MIQGDCSFQSFFGFFTLRVEKKLSFCSLAENGFTGSGIHSRSDRSLHCLGVCSLRMYIRTPIDIVVSQTLL